MKYNYKSHLHKSLQTALFVFLYFQCIIASAQAPKKYNPNAYRDAAAEKKINDFKKSSSEALLKNSTNKSPSTASPAPASTKNPVYTSQETARDLKKSTDYAEKIEREARTKAQNELHSLKFFYDTLMMREGLTVATQYYKYGFVNKQGKIVIPLQYRNALLFKDGMACVQSETGSWGTINKSGDTIIAFKYKESFDFKEGLALVKDWDDKIFFIDQAGRQPFPEKFSSGKNYSDGWAQVKKEITNPSNVNGRRDWKSGFIDKTGSIKIPFEYEYVQDFKEGLAAVSKNGKWGFIDKNNTLVVNTRYSRIKDFENGLANVHYEDFTGYINTRGEEVIPVEFDYAMSFDKEVIKMKLKNVVYEFNREGKQVGGVKDFVSSTSLYTRNKRLYETQQTLEDGSVLVSAAGKFGLISKEGSLMIPLVYDEAFSYSEGLARVVQNKKYGYIDAAGKIAIPIEYNEARSFKSGLAAVKQNLKWGFVNKKGEVIIPFVYDDAKYFAEGLALVCKGASPELCGYIDIAGKEVTQFAYLHYSSEFTNGLAYVSLKEGKAGVIDKDGKVVIPLSYDGVDRFKDGYAIAKKNGKYGYISLNNKIIIPFKYELLLWSAGTLTGSKDITSGKYDSFDASGNIIKD